MKLILTIDRFEGNQAVLITNEKESIVWPKKSLPDGAVEGSVLSFDIFRSEDEEKVKKQLAKDILNEILEVE